VRRIFFPKFATNQLDFGAFQIAAAGKSALEGMIQRIIVIGLAGFAGTIARYWLSGWTARRFGETFPVGTLVVNLLGCFLAGLLSYLMFERFLVSQTTRTVLLIGLLGGFTTFSSFGLQSFNMLRDGEVGLALLNIVLSNAVGLFMVWLGYSLGKLI
jgi:CrcB protein